MRSWRLALGAAALLAVTACGSGDAAPAAGPPVSAPTDLRPSAPAAAPPSAAPDPDRAAPATDAPQDPVEFARFFVAELNRAYLEKDPEAVERLTTPECETCERYLGAISLLVSQDARIEEGYTVEVLEATASETSPEATTVDVALRIGLFVIRGRDDSELYREEPSERAEQSLDLVRSGPTWLVREVDFA